MELGSRILRYRAEHDLSQKELADMCKVSRQTIFMLEKYDIRIAPLTLEKIELVIGKEEQKESV